ncbi:MAG: dihydroorotase [Gammaproteobacteria bacterium]|nr:dihydroorotase [Gammaproteobacteria bacterium]
MQSITITQPDDWHLHVRDGEILQHVVPHTAKQFARAVIMPNLNPPITTTEAARRYRNRIIEAVPSANHFQPLMTLYLTDNTSPQEIMRAKQSGDVHAVKFYPAGATTNSDAGVTDIEKTYDTLACMAENQMPLLVHGEVTDANVDIFDREKRFIDNVLEPLHSKINKLRIVFEHITTQEAVRFVSDSNDMIAATITPHHLLFNRNTLLAGGIRPHYYCLPVLKRQTHQQALIEAATSGNKKFFLGTDSAPHSQQTKESACGCAGIYSAHAAIELYASAFEQAHALDKLEGFASFYGADFYQLPRNKTTITLKRNAWEVPKRYTFSSNESVIPLKAGQPIAWTLSN